ncbi:MAG TPA: DNA polymerase III subunit delta' [Polyangia bacterium]|jgi:DNA polymerase-3 subunit delta'
MEGLRGILGQAQAVGVLRRALASDRLAHAYLFEGPAGVGKATTARALMQALACERTPGEGCGACPPCRKIDEGTHPDLVVVGLQDEKRDILIAQVRDVVRGCAFRPHEAPRRLVLIDPADRMNANAANALLKTLEEPPEATHFVLVAEAPSRLPITIRSRCQRVRFAPLSAAVIAAELERLPGVDAAAARFTAGLSDGSLGRALALSAGGLEERRGAAERLHAAARTGGAAEIFLASSELGRDKEELVEVLALLRVLYRDALLAREGLDDVAPLVNSDRPEQVRAIAAGGGWLGMRRRVAAVAEAEWALQGNVNAQLVLDRLMLRLRECH